MRWGVWCDEPAAGPWLRRLAQREPAPSFVAVRATPADDAVWHGIPHVTFVPDWPALLADRTIEAVLIAGDSDERRAAIRQLAEQDRPVWVWPDARQGLPFAYEVALIAHERTSPLWGIWRHRGDPVLAGVHAKREGGELAGLEHVELTRQICGDDLAPAELAAALQRGLLPDLDLLRWLGAEAARVTTLRTTGPGDRLWKQSVLLAADHGPGASWTGEIVAGTTSTARLQLRHSAGTLVLVEDAAGCWRAESGPDTTPAAPPVLATATPWADVVRVFEWFDACEHSLERRRTIELHSEPVSERTVFKTQMTALGCGVLMGTLLLLLAYLAIAAAVPLPSGVLLVLRALVFAPLVIFLIVQLLLPLSRVPGKS